MTTISNIVLDNKILDPLAEVENRLPTFAAKLKLTHHSPTQTLMSDGPYIYKYIFCDQAKRRTFDGNAQMAAGVAVNNALQWHYADLLWKLNSKNKLELSAHIKLQKDIAVKKALDEFRLYKPVNDKDQLKKDQYLNSIPNTIDMAFQAIGKLGVADLSPTICENHVTIKGDVCYLFLDIIGRSDFEFGNFGIKSFPLGFSRANPCPKGSFLLELKTVWSRVGKLKKDGSYSFVMSKAPAAPSINHLIQVSFYAAAYDYKIPVKLLYVTEQDYSLFDENNCNHLKPEGLKKNFQYIINAARRREKLFVRYQDLPIDEIKKNLIQDVDPMFDHPFYWNIGHTFVEEAKRLWNV